MALVIGTDRQHAAAVAAAERHSRDGLVTTWPVLTETVHLVQRRGHEVARRLLGSIDQGAAQIFDLTPGHLPRVLELMDRYASLPMDLADASLVLCAEETGDGRILSTGSSRPTSATSAAIGGSGETPSRT